MSLLDTHEIEPAVVARLERDADAVLARRAVFGPFAYSLSLLCFTFATEFGVRARFVALALTGVVLLFSAARLALGTPERWSGSLGLVVWRRAFLVSSVALFASYGLYIAIAVRLLGVVVLTTLMMGACVALIVGTAYSLSPRLHLVQLAALLLAGPSLIAVLAADGPGRYPLAVLLSLYLVYVLFLGRRLHAEYWQSAIAQAQLEERSLALARSQRQTRALIEKNPDAMGILRGREIVFVNAAWTSLLQHSSAELVGKPLEAFVHPDDAGALREFLDTGDDATTREFRLLRKDGSAILWEIIPNQPLEYEGSAAHLLVARDVSERNRMRSQLALSERLASIGTLAAGVAHEINNPLTYVTLNLEYVIAELRAGRGAGKAAANELADVAEEARQGADRVQTIVRDLKTFSTAADSTPTAVDVHQVIEMSVKMAAVEVRHRARIVLELGDVPAVVADAGRLGQVFLNLLVNAAQAIPEGKADENVIRIKTSGNATGGVVIQVSDTGSGIRPEHLPRIFDPFFTTKTVGGGTGLGLSICRNVVLSFGGEISVASEVGKGTTFSVLLRPSRAARLTTAPISPRIAPSEIRVLVVDDEAALGRAIDRMLRKDFTVVVEQTAQRALARLVAGERFDVILCDLMMPEMTGMDLLEATRERAPSYAKRFVFMTGGTFTERARSFLESVPNERFDKPIDAARLRDIVRRHAGTGARTSKASLPVADRLDA